MSRAKLWRQQTGRELPEVNTAVMQWGKTNEFRAIAELEAVTGLIFDHTGEDQLKCRRQGLVAKPDGACRTADGVYVGAEVKCPEKPTEEIRPHYMAQLQGECYVCGFAGVYYATWTVRESHVWFVPRSEEYIAEMTLLLDGFLAYVETDEQPPRLRKKPVMPDVKAVQLC